MSARASLLRQPGPRHPVRAHACAAVMRTTAYRHVPEATSLLEALGAQVDDGVGAAVVELHGARLARLNYVIPAISRDPARAATFSQPRHDEGPVELLCASATLGRSDGERFVHCHGLWRSGDGALHAGHLIPESNAPGGAPFGAVHVLGGVEINRTPDPETGFPLLHPSPTQEPPVISPALPSGLFVRIRPNEDLVDTIERLCLAERIDRAVVRASIGSLVGAELERGDGTIDHVPGPVVEVVSLSGRVEPDDAGVPRAELIGVVVDTSGAIAAGRLIASRNVVAVTFELALERWAA